MKLDITSTALEKGIDLAKGFLDKLITPAIEETGLLIKEKVTLWRFKNQVSTVNKAREYCLKQNIKPKEISLKLLCPLLDYAGLEEDEDLQNKWATLLANMVDSEQNIQNHVFPYLLSQISKDEFAVLENACMSKRERFSKLNKELEDFGREKDEKITELKEKIKTLKIEKKWREHVEIEKQLRDYEGTEYRIKQSLREPETVSDVLLQEFEISNLIRLGVIKAVPQQYAYAQPIKIPHIDEYDEKHVDVEIEIASDGDYYILTELGELFIDACSEKK